MSQYDLSIVYIPGEDNTVANGLSCIHPNAFPDEFAEEDKAQMFWFKPSVNAVLLITLCKNMNASKSWPQSGTRRNFGILVKCTFHLTFF